MSKKITEEEFLAFLNKNPMIYERFKALVGLAKDADESLVLLDEVEKQLIAEVQQLGNNVLTAWANEKEDKLSKEMASTQGHIKHSKKNCTLRQRSVKLK